MTTNDHMTWQFSESPKRGQVRTVGSRSTNSQVSARMSLFMFDEFDDVMWLYYVWSMITIDDYYDCTVLVLYMHACGCTTQSWLAALRAFAFAGQVLATFALLKIISRPGTWCQLDYLGASTHFTSSNYLVVARTWLQVYKPTAIPNLVLFGCHIIGHWPLVSCVKMNCIFSCALIRVSIPPALSTCSRVACHVSIKHLQQLQFCIHCELAAIGQLDGTCTCITCNNGPGFCRHPPSLTWRWEVRAVLLVVRLCKRVEPAGDHLTYTDWLDQPMNEILGTNSLAKECDDRDSQWHFAFWADILFSAILSKPHLFLKRVKLQFAAICSMFTSSRSCNAGSKQHFFQCLCIGLRGFWAKRLLTPGRRNGFTLTVWCVRSSVGEMNDWNFILFQILRFVFRIPDSSIIEHLSSIIYLDIYHPNLSISRLSAHLSINQDCRL